MRSVLASLFCGMSLILSIPSDIHAQTDVLTAVVRDDTVTIWNNNVYYPCATSFHFTVSRYLQTIRIVERDTSLWKATCMCYYQLSVDIAGLPAGTYDAVVYRLFRIYAGDGMWRDTIYVIGTVPFTLGMQADLFSIRGYQSLCLPTMNVSQAEDGTGDSFSLDPVYPNPFNGTTQVSIRVRTRQRIDLCVYDVAGRTVARLEQGSLEPGTYTYRWDPAQLPSGVYVVHARTSSRSISAKALFIK